MTGAPELKNQTVTTTNGTFAFSEPAAGGFLVAHKPGLATIWKQMNQMFGFVQASDEKLQLVLAPPAALAGVVLDGTGKPVPHAAVFVSMAVSEMSEETPGRAFNFITDRTARESFAARTDAAGHFRIENFPTNATANLGVQSPGKALGQTQSAFFRGGSLPWRGGQEDIKLVVEPAGNVEGKIVVEGASSPPPIARLTLQPAGPAFFGSGASEPVQSAADGTFRISDVAAGSYRIRADFGTNAVSEWVADTAPVTVESAQTTRDVQVTAAHGGLLEVAVLSDADHQPLPQIQISAYKMDLQSVARSDSYGIVRLRLSPGEYQVAAFRQGMPSAQTSASVEAGQTNRVEIDIVAPKKITGIIRLPDGQPAAGLSVSMIGGFGPNMNAVKTDAAGKFEWEWNSPQYGPNNMNQSLCVLVRDPAHNLAVAQDVDQDSGTLDLKLAPGLTLFGKVTSDAKPVSNATATLVFWTGNQGAWLEGFSRTNIPGQFEISALPPGRRYGITVSAPGYGQRQINDFTVATGPGRQELDPIELKPANLQMAGQVLDVDDQPVADTYVNLSGDGQPASGVSTDREGRFRFEHVCEGSAQISANNNSGSYGNISAEGGDTNIVLRLGQNFNNGPGTTTHKIKGTVSDADGQPVAGAQVAVFPSNGWIQWRKTGTNGAFSLAWALQPWQLQQSGGNAMLVVRDLAHELAATEDLPEDTTNLDVTLKPALKIHGLVNNVDGSPLAGAQVGLWIKTGNNYGQLDQQTFVTDGQGRYEIKSLPSDAEYIIFASANGHGKVQQPLKNDPDTKLMELPPFILKPADRFLAGQVVDQDEKPVSGANVSLNGDGQPNGQMTTDSKGRFHFQVCEGQVQVMANGRNTFGNVSAEGGDTNVVLRLGQNYNGGPGVKPHKLTGVATGPDGQPVSGVRVTVFPTYGQDEWRKTEADGAFHLSWSLPPWQRQSGGGALLIARDIAHNLAVTAPLTEETTHLDIVLKPALTLAGRVEDVRGKSLVNTPITVLLKAGNGYSQINEQMSFTDARGRYEINSLPLDAQYLIIVNAPGHGSKQQPVQNNSATNRLVLPPFVLKLADQVLAGRVLDLNDKPVSGIMVQLNGDGQPNGNTTTDSHGQFHLQVCSGQINLFAYSQYGGGNAQTTATAGDTNVVIRLRSQSGFPRPAPRHTLLKGKPLPDLTAVNLASDVVPAGRPVLLCLFDAGQSLSRHLIHQLDRQAAALAQQNITVVGVQAVVASDETFGQWKTNSLVAFPIGRVSEKSERTKWAATVQSLPWLILADGSHRVVAEGFPIETLEEEIGKLPK